MIAKKPIPVGEALERLLDAIEAPSTDVLATVFGRWDEIVGPAAAQHCRPVAVEEDVLVVEASDAVWASELKWLSGSVIDRINEVCDQSRLRSVSVRVGRLDG